MLLRSAFQENAGDADRILRCQGAGDQPADPANAAAGWGQGGSGEEEPGITLSGQGSSPLVIRDTTRSRIAAR